MTTAAGVHHGAGGPRAAILPFLGVLLLAFLLRVVGLDYNGPFIDESFHSVADAYGNVPHLTGEVLLYPQLSRLVHEWTGLTGARALSAVFGTLTVACVYRLAEIVSGHFLPPERSRIASLAGALLFALSAPALFVSQFANYYAMSFLLFALGLWLAVRGIESGRRISLAAGAVILVVAFASRYLLLGYLPIAMLAVWLGGRAPNGQRTPSAPFWIPFAITFIAYAGWSYEHLLAALQHAQGSGTGLTLEPSLRLRGLVLREALGRVAPVATLAAVGVAIHTRRILRRRGSDARRQAQDLIWLTLGSVWIIGYHSAFAHDLTMESNLTLAVLFGSVLAGLGVEFLAHDVLRVRRNALRAAPLVVLLLLVLAHTASVVREDQTWPDWRPVVEVARFRGADRAASVWSTADNGGMRNTWGVRRADGRMSGNVWQLRAALGPRVDVGSPWRSRRTDELLRIAARNHVDFVIGPLPFRNLRIGSRVHGFVVTDVVDVPHGPASYVLRNVRDATR